MPKSLSTASSLLLAFIVTLFVATIAMTTTAGAVRPVQEEEEEQAKVLICHRDNNVKKPYGPKAIEVAVSSVDGDGDRDHYGQHKGPIATSEAVAQALKDDKEKWGDIIPPVEQAHNGLNWTTVGRAMWENDCQYVEFVEAKPVVFVAPTCDKKGSYTIPTTEGVEYMVDGKVVEAGTYTVNSDMSVTVSAHAQKGYVLEEGSDAEWSYDFVTPTNCDTPGVVLGDTTPQVTTKPAGAVNAGGAGTFALMGLLSSVSVFSLGAMIRKFQN